MIPRLNISFSLGRQWNYWFGKQYEPKKGEYLLNHARTGIVLALRATLPKEGRVGVVAYNCHTVANAVVNAKCTPVFVDITDNLTIDVDSIPADLDAIIVTNLFGIRNDIATIKQRCPKAFIIVDNAHGYGLPAEGDCTVYSINQGKFPALGEGGILMLNGDRLAVNGIEEQYKALPGYGFVGQVKLFVSMLIKAILYQPWLYGWFTMRLKHRRANAAELSPIIGRQMATGVRRLYNEWLPKAEEEIAMQRKNAERIASHLSPLTFNHYIIGENAFMAVTRTNDPEGLKKAFAARGIESETHFKHAIDWAQEFGYQLGSCPKAEELTKQLVMIPTYRKI